MKKLILILLVLGSRIANAQTPITAGTPIQALYSKPGYYYFLNGADTVLYTVCAPTIVIKHDTLIQKVDSVAIQALKICPPPPAPAKQRTAVGISWDIINNKRVITYDDKTTTTL